MKKYINKLFEWLGYVPKEEYEDVEKERDYYRNRPTKIELSTEAHDESIKSGTETFCHFKQSEYFIVMGYCEKVDNYRFVKVLPFQDEDSEDYARICAEELCDMLNEKY